MFICFPVQRGVEFQSMLALALALVFIVTVKSSLLNADQFCSFHTEAIDIKLLLIGCPFVLQVNYYAFRYQNIVRLQCKPLKNQSNQCSTIFFSCFRKLKCWSNCVNSDFCANKSWLSVKCKQGNKKKQIKKKTYIIWNTHKSVDFIDLIVLFHCLSKQTPK